MDNQIQQVKPSDEIDLIELLNRIGRSIKNTFYWFINIIKSFLILLVRKSIWLIFFSIIGGLIGYFLFSNTPRFYSSEMIARSNSINNSIIINSINLLNNYTSNRNFNSLCNSLVISPKDAENIRSIEAFYGIDVNKDKVTDYIDYDNNYNPKDTNQRRVPDIFYLKISVYDGGIFHTLGEGIKRYISLNPYILENNALRRRQTKGLIEEMRKLDSLQKELYFEVPKMQKTGNSQTVLLNDKVSNLYHKDLIELYKKKQELEKDLMLNPDPITIIQDFTQLSRADNPLMQFIVFWVTIFAILGLIVSLIWQFRLTIWDLVKNKQY